MNFMSVSCLNISERAKQFLDGLGGPSRVVISADQIDAIPVYIVTPELIPEIAEDSRLTRASKVASVIFSIFPWTLRDASPIVHALQYPHPLAAPVGVDPETEEGSGQLDNAIKAQFHHMVVAIGTLVLCYGYSQDTMVAKQITRRLSAAYADANLTAPDWDAFTPKIKAWVGALLLMPTPT